jgi:hypothetical protein
LLNGYPCCGPDWYEKCRCGLRENLSEDRKAGLENSSKQGGQNALIVFSGWSRGNGLSASLQESVLDGRNRIVQRLNVAKRQDAAILPDTNCVTVRTPAFGALLPDVEIKFRVAVCHFQISPFRRSAKLRNKANGPNWLFLRHGPKVLRRIGEGLLDTLAN